MSCFANKTLNYQNQVNFAYLLLTLLLLIVNSSALAFHIPAQKLDKQTQRVSFDQPLRYQITAPNVSIDTIDNDPELHHSWQSTKEHHLNFTLSNQALWLTAAVMNATDDPMDVIVDFASPLADEVNMYVIDDSNNRMVKSLVSGTNFDFSRRELPYRSYAIEVTLQPQQVVNLYLRVVDDGNIAAHWYLWNKDVLVEHKLTNARIDGVLAGAFFIFIILNLLAFFGLKEPMYAYFGGFLASYLLTVSILNGSAFQHLWPDSPAINQLSVYLASGLVLLFISLFSQVTQSPEKKGLIQSLQYLNLMLATSVIFLPLLLPQQFHLLLLAIATVTIPVIGAACAFWRLAMRQEHALLHCVIWSVFLLGGVLFTLSQYGVITKDSHSLNIGSIVVILTAIILSFSLVKRIRLEKSAKEQAKSQAAETLQQYFDIYQNAVEGLFSLNLKGELISANPQLVEALGYNTFAQLRNAIRKHGPQIVIGDLAHAKQLLAQVQQENQITSVEVQGLKHDGTHIWGLMSLKVTTNASTGESFVHGAVVDITEKHQAYQKLAYMATHDTLTGVLNRNEFEKTLYNALTDLKQNNIISTMLYIDLERFKLINDTSGHIAGDSLLRQVSDQLKSVLNDQGTLARLGGDEFAVLLPGINGNEAFVLAYRIVEVIKEFRFLWEERIFTIGVSIGMKELCVDDTSLTQIFSNADAACYTAKEKGRNRIHIYTEEDQDNQQHQTEAEWVNVLNYALEKDQFILYYQTIDSIEAIPVIKANKMHYELLLRMKDPQQKIIQPESFIPAAERFNLMTSIDQWVIRSYFRWLSQNPEQINKLEVCSINLSGSSISDPNFKEIVMGLFVEYLIPHDKICFEISESIAIINLNATLDFINLFKNLGCRFSLDDFGTGFSSYGYLKNIPVDYIKIDGNFVKDVLVDPIDKAMVNSINEVGQAIGVKTIAEFVESDAILEQMKQIGVDYAQGYGLHRPSPLSQLVE